MNSELRVSDLIDVCGYSLDGRYSLDGLDDSVVSILARDLKDSVKFYVGKFDEVFPTAIGTQVKDFPAGLPFENTYIEWLYPHAGHGYMRVGVLLQIHDGNFCGEVFYGGNPTSKMKITGMHFIRHFGETLKDTQLQTFSSTPHERSNKDHELANLACTVSMHIVNIMNCSNVSYITGGRGKGGANRLRGGGGKKKLYSYKTLVLDIASAEASDYAGTGAHTSPRIHLRRGHVRRLPTGGTTWVQPCVVGNKENGIVQKDYKLTNSQPA